MSLSTPAKQMRLDQFFEQLLFEHIAARIDAGSSFQALGPATENPRRCIAVDRQRGTTRQNCSADRKRQRPCTAETRTQRSCEYEGALWLKEFATNINVLNFARCAAGNQ